MWNFVEKSVLTLVTYSKVACYSKQRKIPVKKLAFQIHDRDKCQIYISRTHVAAGNLFFLTPKCWWNDSTGVPRLEHNKPFCQNSWFRYYGIMQIYSSLRYVAIDFLTWDSFADTVKLRVVDRSNIQFWILWAKIHST